MADEEVEPGRLMVYEPRVDGRWRHGWFLGAFRQPTHADLAAHLRTLPHAEQVAALVALLRECPDAAVEAAQNCRALGSWHVLDGPDEPATRYGTSSGFVRVYLSRARWWADGLRLGRSFATRLEAMAAADAALAADGWALDGWVLAEVPRVG